jgi:hypothetical protein
MNSPLTLDQLLTTFDAYNNAIWPMQVVAYLLGIVGLFFVTKKSPHSLRVTFGVLSFLWLWTGVVFHIMYFARVYSLAYTFGAVFVLQGLLFFPTAVRPKVSFRLGQDLHSVVGIVFISYAMIGYPLVRYFLGHKYPQAPVFGLTPCPLTVFTFGLFMLADTKLPKYLLVVPLLWAISAYVPVSRRVFEDIGLIIAGVVGTVLMLIRDSKKQIVASQTGSVSNS